MLPVARLPRVVFSIGAASLLCLLANPAFAVTIDMVPVGNAGNAADTTTFGAVAYNYQIGKYEVTNAQYAAFLNAASPTGSNPNGIYSAPMGTDPRGGIAYNAGAADGFKYTSRTNMGDKPVNFVSWYNSLRFANWLNNGQGTGDTETGAYTIASIVLNKPANPRNPGATWFLPSADEWYKAAYYKGGNTNAGYWAYAPQSDTAPAAVTANATGDGSAGASGNFANFNNAASWNSQTGNVTTVGTNGGPSAYGTFDQSGNVWELDERLVSSTNNWREARGGEWSLSNSPNAYMRSDFVNVIGVTTESVSYGFRVGNAIAVPEPSTYVMSLAGLACGGYSVFRRRRAR